MRKILIPLVMFLVLYACSHNLREEFDTSLTKYNDLLSRNELGAASLFVSDIVKEEFVARAASLKDVRIIDCRIVNAKYTEEKHLASVEVEISYYNMYANKVKSLRDSQKWSYIDEHGVKGWRLMSVLPEFK